MCDLPKCPWCKNSKHVRVTGHRHYYCANCGREFDGVDDGDVGYGSPEKYAERQERREQRKGHR